MPRPAPQPTEAVNADSFLDIVASVVSIMIILVVIEGTRIKNAPVDSALLGGAAQVLTALEKDQAAEHSVEGDVLKLAAEIEHVQREAAARALQRDVLATYVSAAEHDIRTRREQMSAQERTHFDLARRVAESRRQLENLEQSRVQVETAQPEPIVVETYPTPISHAVDDNEAHFQLRGGRVAVIPLETLIQQLKADAARQAYKLRDQAELTDTVGPAGGFRLRYTMERKDISPEMALASGRGGAYAQLKRWTLIPVENDLGEPTDAALAVGSAFREALAKHRPGRITITLWIYPDSFDAFRRVRKELYRLGYTVAARPLPEGAPISGSPEGSKSAAQ
jgi:hypothetical protein